MTGEGWLYFPRAEERSAPTILLFPYGGGGRGAYRGLPAALRPLRTAAVVPPGRDHRMAQPPPEDLVTAAEQIAAETAEAVTGPFAFFGHSLGAALAYETIRALARFGGPAPEYLAVSDRPAPDTPRRVHRLSELPDAEFRTAMEKLGRLPLGGDASPELVELALRQLRTDLRLSERYNWRPGPPLDLPIRVFSRAGTPPDEGDPPGAAPTLGWSRLTTGPVTARAFPGGHFFVLRHEREIAEILRRAFTPAAPEEVPVC